MIFCSKTSLPHSIRAGGEDSWTDGSSLHSLDGKLLDKTVPCTAGHLQAKISGGGLVLWLMVSPVVCVMATPLPVQPPAN